MTQSPVEYALMYSAGLCALVFAVSGVSKIGRTSRTMRAMREMRLPRSVQRPWIAAAVPIVEIVLALAFVVATGPVRIAAGLATAIMLLAFTIAVLGVLRRGDDVDCGCFGALSASDRLTAWSVVRNVVLLAAAVLTAVLGSGPQHLVSLIGSASPALVLAVILGWVLTLVVVLVREIVLSRRSAAPPRVTVARDTAPAPLSAASLALGLDPERQGETPMGAPIPDGELVAAGGQTQPLHELGYGRPVLLIFLSAECGSCIPVAEAVPRWAQTLAPMEVRVATSSAPDAIARLAPDIMPLMRYGAAAARQAFGLQRTPAAIALGGQQHAIVASPVAYGLDEIEDLVDALAGVNGG